MKRIFLALLCMPILACASSGTFSKIQPFSTLPGYGVLLQGAYQSTAGEFDFYSPVNSSELISFGGSRPGVYSATLSLAPRNSIIDVLSATVNVNLKITFIDLVTGDAKLPPDFFKQNNFGNLTTTASGQAHASVATLESPELRFSMSRLTEVVRVSNQNGTFTGSTGVYECQNYYGDCTNSAAASTSSEMNYTVNFGAGQYLMPSVDPSCAALNCMHLSHDSLKIGTMSVGLTVGMVPEPSTYRRASR